jgi:hypothetical protein
VDAKAVDKAAWTQVTITDIHCMIFDVMTSYLLLGANAQFGP